MFAIVPAASERVRAASPYDHLHLAVPDPPKAVEWYLKHMNAQPARPDDQPNRVRFGETIYAFNLSADATPSAGSSIDHIAFSVPDVDAKMKELEAAGVKIVTPASDVSGFFRAGVVEDPWGTRLEILRDPDLLGLHHVHLRVPDPQNSLRWYVDKFGGMLTKLRGRDAVRYSAPDIYVVADRDGNAPPSQGHAIDHLGWGTPDLERLAAELKAKGVKFQSEPRLTPSKLRIAFIEDPYGIRIELVQR